MLWAGKDGGPALVVVDPAGPAVTADLDSLPTSWHALAERYQIAWCRVRGARRPEETVEDALETLAEQSTRVDLIAGGPACELALSVAAHFPQVVRGLLLVDPAGALDSAEITARGVRVAVLAGGPRSRRDRAETPVSLGHPFVVDAVTAALPST